LALTGSTSLVALKMKYADNCGTFSMTNSYLLRSKMTTFEA
jgi:hypothetical protein